MDSFLMGREMRAGATEQQSAPRSVLAEDSRSFGSGCQYPGDVLVQQDGDRKGGVDPHQPVGQHSAILSASKKPFTVSAPAVRAAPPF